MKLSQTIETIFSDNNVTKAIGFLKNKKNSCGDDGVLLHDLEEYWKINQEKILNELITGTYKPQIVHEKTIIQPNGKHRQISLFSSVDRLILRVLQQNLQSFVDEESSQYSYAYQTGRGIIDAVKQAAKMIESGNEFVVEMDIKDFFNNIDHNILFDVLSNKIEDEQVYQLLKSYIECIVESDLKLSRKKRGTIQGSAISPILSNIFMQEFDYWMEEKGYQFVRFADDINVYTKNYDDGFGIYESVSSKLREYCLEINENKKVFIQLYQENI